MVNIDVPTAVAAVLISVLLGFLSDNITGVVQRRLQKSNQRNEDIKEWYSELRRIGDEIRITVATSSVEIEAWKSIISPDQSEVREQIDNIDIDSFDTVGELFTLVRQIDGVSGITLEAGISDEESDESEVIQLGEPPNDEQESPLSSFTFQAELDQDGDPLDAELTDDMKQQVLDNTKEDLIEYITNIEQEATKEARDNVREDMEHFYIELRNHYARRPSDAEPSVINALTEVMTSCYAKRMSGNLDEESSEELNEKVKDMIGEAMKARADL